jgi:coproporphyrinogen III oxidase-like Fe-S oxidoreductase
MNDWDAVGPSAVSNRRTGSSYIRGQNCASDRIYEADPLGTVDFSLVQGIDAMFEFLMMALRTSEGFPLQRFKQIFSHDPIRVFGDLPTRFPSLLQNQSGCWRATGGGMDMLNRLLVSALEASEDFDPAQ